MKILSNLRNDVAHSRFITPEDFKIIASSYDQISTCIPDFETFGNEQSIEDNLAGLFSKLKDCIYLLEEKSLLDKDAVLSMKEVLRLACESFWVNSFYREILNKLLIFKEEIVTYSNIRFKPGGLLEIQKWKKRNTELFKTLIKLINDAEI